MSRFSKTRAFSDSNDQAFADADAHLTLAMSALDEALPSTVAMSALLSLRKVRERLAKRISRRIR